MTINLRRPKWLNSNQEIRTKILTVPETICLTVPITNSNERKSYTRIVYKEFLPEPSLEDSSRALWNFLGFYLEPKGMGKTKYFYMQKANNIISCIKILGSKKFNIFVKLKYNVFSGGND